MVPPPQPSPPPTQGAQYAQQFLSNILSQRGPTSLPYAEDVKWLIRQHLVSLIEIYPSLHTKTSTFTHNDGRTVNLLQSEGTVPMLYQDIVYNIPIIIWLMETYPRHPPFVYVAPTRDMIIKRGHPHVSPSGLVSIPYIHTWVFPSSNLLDLARNLSHTFASDPPLYTKTPRPNPNPNPNPYSTGRFPPSPHRPEDDPAEVYRRNAINKLVESFRGDAAAMRKSREAEVESLFAAQAALRQREEELSKGLREMMEEKEGLEQQLQVVLMNSDVLEAWVRENGEKGARKGSVEIDEVFELGDSLSKQMVECSAADLAVEDVVYSLDKAVWEGSIAVDAYLRSIRSLSREQFFHRATAAKVRAAQMQAQVTSMAARATLYGV